MLVSMVVIRRGKDPLFPYEKKAAFVGGGCTRGCYRMIY